VIEAAGETPLAPPAAPRPISYSYAVKLMSNEGWSIVGLVFCVLGVFFAPIGLVLSLGILAAFLGLPHYVGYLVGGISAFVGLPFLFLGLVFLAVGGSFLAWRYQLNRRQVQVLKLGDAVLGCVTDMQQNFAVRVKGRFPWSIAYQYEVDGQNYTGNATTLNQPRSQLQPGRPVYVLYLPENPVLSSLYPHP
jgi:membrane protein implicated in regulation of membrane protease activity